MEVSRDEYEGRKKLCDERFERDKKRISDAEDDISTLTKLITQLAEIVKTSAESDKDQEQRIRSLENQPAKRYDAIWAFVVGAAISGAIGLLFRFIP